jgi:hypothetical protein
MNIDTQLAMQCSDNYELVPFHMSIMSKDFEGQLALNEVHGTNHIKSKQRPASFRFNSLKIQLRLTKNISMQVGLGSKSK